MANGYTNAARLRPKGSEGALAGEEPQPRRTQRKLHMQTVLNIIGTRPEAIKMAPVVAELRKHPDRIRCVVCATGQHRQMLDQVLELFAIRPDLRPRRDAARPVALPAYRRLCSRPRDEVAEKARPDWILAQGDTTTVAVARSWRSIAASGSATSRRACAPTTAAGRFRRRSTAESPICWPTLYFAPTQRARDTLLKEGVPATRHSRDGQHGHRRPAGRRVAAATTSVRGLWPACRSTSGSC